MIKTHTYQTTDYYGWRKVHIPLIYIYCYEKISFELWEVSTNATLAQKKTALLPTGSQQPLFYLSSTTSNVCLLLFICIWNLYHMHFMPRQAHPPWFSHYNNIFSASYCFLPRFCVHIHFQLFWASDQDVHQYRGENKILVTVFKSSRFRWEVKRRTILNWIVLRISEDWITPHPAKAKLCLCLIKQQT
jgi:succinate dehydrogenase hydrophobic anchor subunit